jgi:hypothetical protein
MIRANLYVVRKDAVESERYRSLVTTDTYEEDENARLVSKSK